jgi:ELWxxDGT repeat protein
MRATLVLSLLALSLSASAQTPYLVKDINTTTNSSPSSSVPDGFYRVGSRVYFAAAGLGKTGHELWSTDGTPGGTALVADIVPGVTSSWPSHFVALNGKLVFNAFDEAHSEELWISDGTSAGTRLIADIAPGTSRSSPGDRIAYHGKLLFSADDGLSGRELWITDGTSTGTKQLKDIVPGANGSNPGSFVIFNDTVYFSAASNLWKSDGTAAGTVQVKALGGLAVYDLVVSGPRLLFAAGGGLWVSDGTDAGTQKLFDVNIYVGTLTPFGDKVLFAGQVNGVGSQFWISDGTAAGTHLLRDIGTNAVRAVPFITVAGNAAFFTAWTSANGQELWKTDGTEAGTVMVKDIAPGAQDSTPFGIVAAGDKVYFAAGTATGGAKTLWVSDGTAAGTQPVRSDVTVSVDYSDAAPQIVSAGGLLYFGGANALNGFEPWVSDGTAAGTRMLANIAADDAPSSFPKHLVAAGDRVFFDAWDGSGTLDPTFGAPHQLWSSDGTEAGTHKLADVTAATTWTPSGRVVYFTKGTELWTSDGTPEGTGPATELAGRFPSKPSSVAVAGDRIFATIGNALWATSAAAGSPAVSLNVTSGSFFIDAGGPTMFFIGSQLWITDGTAAGTMLVVRDVGGSPNATIFANGNVWFLAGLKLWKSDGTFEGSVLVKTLPGSFVGSLTAAGKNIFVVAGNGQLWVSDGTDAGTHALAPVPAGGKIAATGDRVVLPVGTSPNPLQLWVSDGTDAGTHVVRDPGPFVASPIELASIAGFAYFSAYDSTYGMEVWMTDGTADGTKLAADVEPGSGWSYPTSYARAGERAFFAATTTAAGTELYALPLPSTPRLRVEDVRVTEGDGGTAAARFTVTLSSAQAQNVTVDYATSDGTATAGSDYDAASGTLTFAPGETSKRIDVAVHGDTAPENDENFFVTLRNAAGATLEKGVATAVIADDDQAVDVAPALDFLQTARATANVNVTNAGPRTATGVVVTGTVTPFDLIPINCFSCPLQVAPGASVSAFQTGGSPSFQQYFTATVSAAQSDPQPSNNSIGWTASYTMAMDALYLAPGGQGNVFVGDAFSSGNVTVASSNASVLTVPSSLAMTATKTATFVAHAVAPGTATVTVSNGATTIGTLAVNVVAPGTKVRWPGAFRFFVDNAVAFDQRAAVTIDTGGKAPYSGLLATGLVTVSENGRELGRLTLTQAPAKRWTLPVYVTDLGANTLTVSYSGDDNFLPSTGTWSTTATTGAATIAATPDRLGTNATVHVTVTGSPAAAPTGTITLGEAGVIATKQATLTASPVAGVAQADVALTNVTPGVHTLLIGYSGDSRYRAGTQNVRMPEPKGRAVRH